MPITVSQKLIDLGSLDQKGCFSIHSNKKTLGKTKHIQSYTWKKQLQKHTKINQNISCDLHFLKMHIEHQIATSLRVIHHHKQLITSNTAQNLKGTTETTLSHQIFDKKIKARGRINL